MSVSRGVKHFIVTLEKGSVQIARAREVIPKHRYEIIQTPIAPSYLRWNLEGIGLGEHTEKSINFKCENLERKCQ